MDFRVIRPQAPIKPAGQATSGSSAFTIFLVVGGAAIIGYELWKTQHPKPSDPYEWSEEDLRKWDQSRPQRARGFKSYLKRKFQGSRVVVDAPNYDVGIVVLHRSSRHLSDQDIRDLDEASGQYGFHLKEWDNREVFFEG